MCRHERQARIGIPDFDKYTYSWKYLILLTLSKLILNYDNSLPCNEDSMERCDYSEAFICRLIYYQADALDQTCPKIAGYLNLLQAPTSYVKDGRLVAKRKRKIKTATSGIWTLSRVRAILTNPTYKGLFMYGKRSKKNRELIERQVPATLPEDRWDLRPIFYQFPIPVNSSFLTMYQ